MILGSLGCLLDNEVVSFLRSQKQTLKKKGKFVPVQKISILGAFFHKMLSKKFLHFDQKIRVVNRTPSNNESNR